MTALIEQFSCLSDNFGVLIHDPATKATATIDAPDGEAVLAALARRGWTLTHILLTHHHADHVQGVPALRAAFPKALVTGPAKEAARIEGLDVKLSEGDRIEVGSLAARIIETPGHTAGHICYWFEAEKVLFAGDTLFALGCGRVFETELPVMHDSLQKLAVLPRDTQVYCGHEYTLSNARFAVTVDPDNEALRQRAAVIEAKRAKGEVTLPTSIGEELDTNPFLRPQDAAIRRGLGMTDASAAAVFSELRERKNRG